MRKAAAYHGLPELSQWDHCVYGLRPLSSGRAILNAYLLLDPKSRMINQAIGGHASQQTFHILLGCRCPSHRIFFPLPPWGIRGLTCGMPPCQISTQDRDAEAQDCLSFADGGIQREIGLSCEQAGILQITRASPSGQHVMLHFSAQETAYSQDNMLHLIGHEGIAEGISKITLSCRIQAGQHPAGAEGLWGTDNEVPSFLYGMPLGNGRVFLEETCLVSKPGLPFATLKRRLERRLDAMGLKVRTV